MPNQMMNEQVEEPTPEEKQSIVLLGAIQSHLALMKEYRNSAQPWDHHRSGEVVETLFRCEWLELDAASSTCCSA